MAITHPSLDQLDLSNVLSALGDETRLAMIARIAPHGEVSCGEFAELGSKTVLSYHMAKLREAGLIKVRAQSTRRYVSLRRDELNARFPGLIDTVVRTQAQAPKPEPVVTRDTYDWVID